MYLSLLKKFNGLLLVVATSNSPGWAATLYILAVTFNFPKKEFRKVKQIFLRSALALAVALGGSTAYAQMPQGEMHGPRQPMSADQRLQMMTQQLDLTSDQQAQIKPILEAESQQMQAVHADTSLSQQDRMSKMQAIRENTNSQIKPILTPDQQTKWQQMMQRHGQRGGIAPQGAPPSQPQ